MAEQVIVEPARKQDDAFPVSLEGRVWRAICTVGRLNGFAVSDEQILSHLDAGLFADALKQGASGVVGPEARVGLRQLVGLLERGGVVITSRERT